MDDTIKSIKVLVVEDFEFTRKVEIEALRELGFTRFAEAGDGHGAIRKLETEKDIGLIISDWNMPGMNGYELLLDIRDNEDFRSVPFIMATAQGEHGQAEKALKCGADRFITKPFTTGELREIIVSVFAEKGKADMRADPRKPPRKTDITAAHIQITDHLALGVLQHMIATEMVEPKYFNLKTRCMPSWNPVRRALEKGEVDAAFILAPLAMDIFSTGVPVNLVLLAHKNGSICVKNTQKGGRTSLYDTFKSKIFLLPHTLSVHHMLADMFLREIGLKLGPAGAPGADVQFEVIPPVRMPELLTNHRDACAFAVAEPIGSKTVFSGTGERLFYSGDLWENHPCCVVVMRREFLENHPEATHEFVGMLVRAGNYIAREPEQAADIAVSFLDPDGELEMNAPLLQHVLSQPSGIRTDDLFPVIGDLDRMQRYMHNEMGVGGIIDLEKFADLRFAEAVYREMPAETGHIAGEHNSAALVTDIIKKRMNQNGSPFPLVETPLSRTFRVDREKGRLKFRLSSDMKLVNQVIRETKSFLTDLGFKNFSGMNLILRELLINAVEHGSRNDPGKEISCTVSRMKGALFKVMVKDEGEGFDYTGISMTLPEDKEQIRQRGYPFIKAFSEAIEFDDRGSRITVFHRICEETLFEVTERDRGVVIRPSGDITAADINGFRVLLKELTDKGYAGYCFDFSEVEEIDSMGFSAFVILAGMVAEKNRETVLEIVNANAEIRELFCMTHLSGTYRINAGQTV